MSITSKSPAAVLAAALKVAGQSLPAYSHRCSPKKFTQHQLFACLVLKNFLKTDYRGVVIQLEDCRSLLEILNLWEENGSERLCRKRHHDNRIMTL
jgi:hypothetical protein